MDVGVGTLVLEIITPLLSKDPVHSTVLDLVHVEGYNASCELWTHCRAAAPWFQSVVAVGANCEVA